MMKKYSNRMHLTEGEINSSRFDQHEVSVMARYGIKKNIEIDQITKLLSSSVTKKYSEPRTELPDIPKSVFNLAVNNGLVDYMGIITKTGERMMAEIDSDIGESIYELSKVGERSGR